MVQKTLKQKLQSAKLSECVICIDRECCMIVLPCGHMCLCEKCSEGLKFCPVCRGSAQQTVKVYKSWLGFSCFWI